MGLCMSHRDEVFEEEPESDFLWCLHCERAYQRGEHRKVEIKKKFRDLVPSDMQFLEMCPYEDCDGDTVVDAWDWERVREDNGYPEIPQKGVVYPLYPDRKKKDA